MRTDTVLFDASIAAGSSQSLERRLPYAGKVKKMTITNYPGQQKTLQVKPYMLRAPDIYASLAKFAGDKPYFSGDDTQYEIAMSLGFLAQDRLCVDVANVGAYPYDLYVLFEVEYEVG